MSRLSQASATGNQGSHDFRVLGRSAGTGARIHGARATLLEGVNEGDVVVLDQSPR